MQITIKREAINPERLDEDLRALAISGYDGLSMTGHKVWLHVKPNTPADDVRRLQAAVDSHDPAQRSSQQADRALLAARRLADKPPERIAADLLRQIDALTARVDALEATRKERKQNTGGSL